MRPKREFWYSTGLAHQACTRPEIIQHFVFKYFGQFKQKHYQQALGRLAKDGRASFANGRQNDHDPITFR